MACIDSLCVIMACCPARFKHLPRDVNDKIRSHDGETKLRIRLDGKARVHKFYDRLASGSMSYVTILLLFICSFTALI